ncbi:MAG: hypothetical protein OIF40_07920 [Mangrovicoccus sp.]|nr:hypothetical protein [Mangrovicoccus sp.]
MIMCSCNRIGSGTLKSTIAAILKEDPQAVITPGRLFHRAGYRFTCGCCVELITELIDANLHTQAQANQGE